MYLDRAPPWGRWALKHGPRVLAVGLEYAEGFENLRVKAGYLC